jgi:hypothetical protein
MLVKELSFDDVGIDTEFDILRVVTVETAICGLQTPCGVPTFHKNLVPVLIG